MPVATTVAQYQYGDTMWEQLVTTARRQRAQGDDFAALATFNQALQTAIQATDVNGKLQVLREMQRYYCFLSLSDTEAKEHGLPTFDEISAQIES